MREILPATLVATLAAAFGAALVTATTALLGALAPGGGQPVLLLIVEVLQAGFVLLALYVGGVVVANVFSALVAGRLRSIALRRLLGATARTERRAIAASGLVVGVAGALIGTVGGVAAADAGLAAAVRLGVFGPSPETALAALGLPVLTPAVAGPAVAVVAVTWAAAWMGTRTVLAVAPVQAFGSAVAEPSERVVLARTRLVAAVVALVLGTSALLGGVLLGRSTALGFVVALGGGLASFTGLVALAPAFVPRAVAAVSRPFAGAPSVALAAAGLSRHPVRSSRAAVGVFIGVTLVTTLLVAVESFERMLVAARGAELASDESLRRTLDAVEAVFASLIGFAAVLAAVGLVSTVALGVFQRRREFGLLRALGASAAQLRASVVAESVLLVGTVTGLGLLLGVLYGWCGALSLLGSVSGMPLLAPSVPFGLLALVVLGGLALAAVASAQPARRVGRMSAVSALSAD